VETAAVSSTDAAVEEDRRLSLDRIDNRAQHRNRGGHAILLAASVAGNLDRCGARAQRLACVLAAQDGRRFTSGARPCLRGGPSG